MLKTWIPGTTDFRDQGLDPTDWVNDNVEISNDGKLGKCLYFNGSNARLSSHTYSLGEKWSWSVWIKDDPDVTGWRIAFILNSNGSDADTQTALWVKADETRLEVCNDAKWVSTVKYIPGQWNHIAQTYDGTTTNVYLNGSRISGFTSPDHLVRTNMTIGGRSTSVDGGHVSTSNYYKGYLNDFRIWDNEVLTLQQIKRLSQGLCLHYRLSGVGGENIFQKTNKVFDNNGARLSSTTVNNGLIIDSTAPNGKYRSWNLVAENGTNRGIYYTYTNSNITLDDLTANEIYTLSFWIRCSKSKNLIVSSLAESQTIQSYDDNTSAYNSNSNIILSSNWERHCVSFKWTSTSKVTTCFYLRSLDENVVLDIAAPKLEKGSYPTPWLPNPSDPEYHTMGLDDGIEYDCSGFGNNGVKTNISNDNNTSRYIGSYQFNGNNSQVKGHFEGLQNFFHNDFTISFWVYDDDKGNRSIYIGNYQVDGAGGGIGIEKTVGNGLRLWWCGDPDYYPSGFAIPDKEWTHIAITKTNSQVLFYKNGTLINTYTYSLPNSMLDASSICFGVDNRTGDGGVAFKGNMSDVRFYATALSASDILSLYNLGGSLDSNGTFHTYEYVEV